MKILQIASAPISYLGGTEKIIWEISKRLAKKNKVTILQTTLYEPKKKVGISYKKGVEIITCKNDFFLGGYGYSSEFKKKLKQIWKDYDIAHIHGHGRYTSNFAMGFLNKKKPFIYSGQGFFHSKKNYIFKKIYDILFKSRLKKASVCTALTKLEKTKLLNMGVDAKKIRIIPGGVDLKEFKPLKNLNSLRKKYIGGDINKKILLYIGRIHESKGLQYVINAIKNIDLKFIIVGENAGYESKLKLMVKNFNIKNKVKFLGKVGKKELIELYNISDIFILFSGWEGFGLVVIEAMAFGKPVIVSNKGALPLLVKDGENGLVVNYPNTKELKSKIKRLLEDDNQRKKLGKKAKEFSKKFDWNKIVKIYLSTYKTAWRSFNG